MITSDYLNSLRGYDRAQDALDDLMDFEARSSPNGLFLRYCRGRVRGFMARQVMTLVGSLSLLIFVSVQIGLATLLVALLGEAIDCTLLWAIFKKRDHRTVTRRDKQMATLTGAIQAVTIAACVIIVWRLVDIGSAQFFAAAFLTGATINAGIVRPYFRPAADARLLIYVLTLAGMLILDVSDYHQHLMDAGEHGLMVMGTLILAFASLLFISFVGRTHAQRARFEHALLAEKHRLELSRQALVSKEQQARQLALVAEHANDSVIITTPEGVIEWVNDTFTRLTGYTAEEAIGRTPGDLLNGPETSEAAINEIVSARRENRAARVELQNQTKSGRRIWMETSLTPIFDADGKTSVVIAVEREITEAKQREAELARARIAAEDAATAKSRFLATMSHEIRTPMNGVIGVAGLLSETDLDESQKHYVDMIIDSGQALLTIINDVLDLSKIQSGKPVIITAPFSIQHCLEGVAELLRPGAEAKGVALTCDCGPSLPTVNGDAGRIRQILLNLIGNAIKFTSTGQITVRLASSIEAGLLKTEITVRDTGIGIPSDRVEQIFESFTQADSDITREFGGTGLGLTISRMLAREMGGDISVTSEIGRGSEFRLTLPLPIARRDAGIGASPSPASYGTAAKHRVLIAEDNKTNALIVRKMLEPEGHALELVENGQLVVEAFLRQRPDLIFMDVSMPVKDGLQATREIRAYEVENGLPPCPIIALTANAFAEDKEACLAAGLDGFLTKPIAKADLLDCLRNQLRRTKPAEQGRKSAMGL